MIETSTKEARGYFLLEFTRQLIKNNKNINIYLLDQILKEKFPEKPKELPITKEEIQQKIKQRTKPLSKENHPEKLIKDLKQNFPINKGLQTKTSNKKRVLRVPEPRLPQRLSYLKPTATSESINLSKIDALVRDPNVRTIEVEGADQKAIVGGAMGKKKTSILLTKQEIDEILNEFSAKSKIPISEGITKIAIGNLTLTSIKSGEDAHFIIRKIISGPNPKPFYT